MDSSFEDVEQRRMVADAYLRLMAGDATRVDRQVFHRASNSAQGRMVLAETFARVKPLVGILQTELVRRWLWGPEGRELMQRVRQLNLVEARRDAVLGAVMHVAKIELWCQWATQVGSADALAVDVLLCEAEQRLNRFELDSDDARSLWAEVRAQYAVI